MGQKAGWGAGAKTLDPHVDQQVAGKFSRNRKSINPQKVCIYTLHTIQDGIINIIIPKSANVSKRKTHASDNKQNSTVPI